jgi:hypothetical protein
VLTRQVSDLFSSLFFLAQNTDRFHSALPMTMVMVALVGLAEAPQLTLAMKKSLV